MVFAATAGDSLQIDITTPDFKNAVLLQDTADGNFAVGDVLDVTDFNGSQVGNGTDLTILAHIGDFEFSGNGNLNFVAPYTGQYAIAIGNANDDISFCCDYTVTLSNNVGTVGVSSPPGPATPVPTMSEWALITLAMLIAGIVFVRRKQLV